MARAERVTLETPDCAATEKMRGFATAATAQAQEHASSANQIASNAINDATELAAELPGRPDG